MMRNVRVKEGKEHVEARIPLTEWCGKGLREIAYSDGSKVRYFSRQPLQHEGEIYSKAGLSTKQFICYCSRYAAGLQSAELYDIKDV